MLSCLAPLLALVVAAAPATASDRPLALPVASGSPALPSVPHHTLRKQAIWVAVAGGVVLLGGASLVIVGDEQKARAQRSGATAAEIQSRITSGRHNELGGVGLMLAGACALGVSWLMWDWPLPRTPMKVIPVVTPDSGALVLQGKLP